MIALPFGEHERIRPLFQAFEDQLAVNAILEGTAPATIYVDHPGRPRAAFTWWGHHCFLAGSERDEEFNEAVGRLFREALWPHAPASGLDHYELRAAAEGWDGPAVRILQGHDPIQARHHYYRFREPKHDRRTPLPEGMHLRPIDAALVEDERLKNLDILRDELCSERASVEDFLARSFGVCALQGDEIAGMCTSEYNSGERCEVGVVVLEPYRRRGLATAMASALIEEARSRGVTQIGWHCYARNAASIATALKVGFEKVHEYAAYIAWVDPRGG
jgi:RimJ/RimL family protein N-acetyltransferase